MGRYRYHVNPETGTVARCSAQEGNCPFRADDGSEATHYPNAIDARRAYEEKMKGALFIAHQDMTTSSAVRTIHKLIKSSPFLTAIEGEHGLLTDNFDHTARAQSYIKANIVYRGEMMNAVIENDYEKAAGYLKLATISDRMTQVEMMISDYGMKRSAKIDKYLKERLQEAITWGVSKKDVDDWLPEEIVEETRGRRANSKKLHEDAEMATTEDGRKVSYDVALIGLDEDGKRVSISREERKRIMGEIKDNSHELVDSFDENLPDSGDDWAPEGFEYLDSGAEGNAYLHKKSMIVYKVPHSENPYIDYQDTSSSSRKLNRLFRLSAREAKRLPRGYKYMPTFAMTSGINDIGITAQPYIDPARYIGYDLVGNANREVSDRGYNDLHSGNIKADVKTGMVYLHDCLTWSRDDLWDRV